MNPSPRILTISVVIVLLAVAVRQQVQIERLEDRMEGLSAEARERVVSGDGKEDVIRMPGAPGVGENRAVRKEMPTKEEAPAIAVNPGHVGAKGVRLTRRTEAAGQDSRDASPRLVDAETTGEIQETSVPVPPGITSRQIRVYVDTNRVASWPEIDAVELVGVDGSRQWASESSASSSYSELYGNVPR